MKKQQPCLKAFDGQDGRREENGEEGKKKE
jgi:hypothetical protein